MSPSLRILLPLAVGLCGVAAYLAVQTHAARFGPREVVFPAGDAGPEGADVDTGEAGEPARVAVSAPAGAAVDRAAIDMRLDFVAGLLRASRRDPPRLELRHPGGGVGIPGIFIAGTAALPLARRWAGPQLLRFDLPGGRAHYRVVRLRDDDPATVVLAHGIETVASGRVVDSSGAAIEGAAVWLAGAAATTDETGRFTLPAVPLDSGLPLVVRRKGFAALYRVLTREQFAALGRAPLTLAAGTRLRVRVRGDSAVGVRILPGAERDSRLLDYPFFWPVIEPSLPAAADGVLEFDCLPRGATVFVVSRDPAARFLGEGGDHDDDGGGDGVGAAAIRLDGPEVQHVVRAAKTFPCTGRVIDLDGAPVAAAILSARPASNALSLTRTAWLLPPDGYLRGAAVGRSGPAGEFALELPPGDAHRITVEAAGRVGLEYEGRFALATALELWSPALPGTPAPAGTPTLQLESAAGGMLTLRLEEGGEQRSYRWNTDDPLALRLPRRGLYRVSATRESAAGEPVLRTQVLVDGAVRLPLP